MPYEPRVFQAVTTNTPPTGTDPMVDNTANGDVQAIKLIDATAGSTTPLVGQMARALSLPTAWSVEDVALLTTLLGTPALPAGAATAARQDTGNTSLASIDAGIPAALGQTTKVNSMAVVPASDYQMPTIPYSVTPTVTSISSNNADMVASMDVTNYKSGAIYLSGFGSATIQIQFSGDNGVTWVNNAWVWRYSNNSFPTSITATDWYLFNIPAGGLMRIRSTVYASGTIAGTLYLSVAPVPFSMQPSTLYNATGSALTTSSPSDAATNNSVPLWSFTFPSGYNGTTWDRQRNNNSGTVFASAARTATANADVTTYNAKTFRVILNITAAPNTASTITVSIREKDSISSNYITVLTGAAETGTVDTGIVPVTKPYSVGAGLVTTANVSAAEALARTMNVLVTHSNADSWTYSVSVELGV